MGRLRELLNKHFTDRVDASLDISLFEYGLIRNPKTGTTIYCIGTGENGKEYALDWTTITVDDVKEVLQEMAPGFFSCIDSSLESELDQLEQWPDDIANIIQSIDSYNGWFKDANYYESNKYALRGLARRAEKEVAQ